MTAEKPRILVIDDEVVNIRIIGEALGGDFDLIFATSGEQGTRIAQDIVPDLVLLDVMMPDMNGYEVCARLKADPRTAAAGVIFITGLDTPEEELQGLEAGAIDFITKPVRPRVVRARVRNHMALLRKLPPAADAEPEAGDVRISKRQKEVLEWMRAGKTNSEIALIIGSSEANVKYHIRQVMDKLDARNRAQVVAKAVSRKLIQPK